MNIYSLISNLGYKKQDWSLVQLPEYVRQCGVCSGHGVYKQTYTVGCGGGSYQSEGCCDWCHGIGLRIDEDSGLPHKIRRAEDFPISIINQIVVAKQRKLEELEHVGPIAENQGIA